MASSSGKRPAKSPSTYDVFVDLDDVSDLSESSDDPDYVDKIPKKSHEKKIKLEKHKTGPKKVSTT